MCFSIFPYRNPQGCRARWDTLFAIFHTSSRVFSPFGSSSPRGNTAALWGSAAWWGRSWLTGLSFGPKAKNRATSPADRTSISTADKSTRLHQYYSRTIHTEFSPIIESSPIPTFQARLICSYRQIQKAPPLPGTSSSQILREDGRLRWWACA